MDAYLTEKMKRDTEIGGRKLGQLSAVNRGPPKANRPVNREKGEYEVSGRELAPKLEEWDITGLPGADLLSESVRTNHFFLLNIAF